MRVLVVGSGGREHAIAWKLSQSDRVTEVVSAPGNPGMAEIGTVIPIDVLDFAELTKLAAGFDLVVIGPEQPLVAGITDHLAAQGTRVFGPSKAAALIEGSKVFCRDLALKYGVPVAQGESFADPDAAFEFAKTISPPIVVKAEALAAGKGVLICASRDEARSAIDNVLREGAFGGGHVIVEEFLDGRETSIFCITDGKTRIVLDPAQDYKRALDGDAGLNTGGMGAYSPVPWFQKARDRAVEEVVFPLIDGLTAEGRPYVGCFYAGLMVTDKGPYLIEVNCRFGDPETQVLMPRLSSDLAEMLVACVDGTLGSHEPAWRAEACVSVVVASGGYPGDHATGVRIEGVDEAEALDDVVVFHAGTASRDGRLVSAGGRVLSVSALGVSIDLARSRAYEAAGCIKMDGKHYRTDIAEGVA